MSNYTDTDTNLNGVVDDINNWNGDSVHTLKDLITEYYSLTEGKETSLLDMSSLPHAELIPEDLRSHTSYPIWAVDRRGYALTGSMDSIEHVDAIREYYNARQ